MRSANSPVFATRRALRLLLSHLGSLNGTAGNTCAGYTSYRMWLNQRTAFGRRTAKNQFPTITGNYSGCISSPLGTVGAEVFVLASTAQLNASGAVHTSKNTNFQLRMRGEGLSGKEMPIANHG